MSSKKLKCSVFLSRRKLIFITDWYIADQTAEMVDSEKKFALKMNKEKMIQTENNI